MKTKNLVGMSMLIALVVVLQGIATFFPMNPNITLTLVPIVIGAAVYGKNNGALLGLLFGIVVLFIDPSVKTFMGINPYATVILVLLKGAAGGWAAGLIYELASKKSIYLGGVLAALICPIVNTGIFCIGMLLFFKGLMLQSANGTNLLYFVLFGLVGINFIIELCTNLILSPAIVRIIKTRK